MRNTLDKIIVIGDRVLIQPDDGARRTQSGLYLPAGYQEKEDIQSGYILKCGPGYALPTMDDGEEWNAKSHEARYVPLQVQPGDGTESGVVYAEPLDSGRSPDPLHVDGQEGSLTE